MTTRWDWAVLATALWLPLMGLGLAEPAMLFYATGLVTLPAAVRAAGHGWLKVLVTVFLNGAAAPFWAAWRFRGVLS